MDTPENIQTEAPQSAPPALERVTDNEPDSASAILGDLRQSFETPEPIPAPAPALAPEPTPTPVEEPPAETPEPEVIEPEIVTPESTLAPIFTLATLPAEESIPQAVDVIRNLHAYDPDALKLLVNAVFQSAPKTFEEWVCEDLGITPEQIPAYLDWQKAGGPAALPAFPEPEKEGDYAGWVTLPNGVQLDVNTPEGRERYETQKALHELKSEKQQAEATQRQAEAERQAEQQRYQEQLEAQAQQARADEYIAARYTVRDQLIEEAVGQLAEGDKLFGQMFRAFAANHIENHPDINAIGEQAARHVLGGTGRVPEFARSQDAVIRRELNTLKQDFSRAMLRVNRAEIAATVTAPKLPPGTRRVETQPQLNPDDRQAQSLDELLREARAYDVAQRAGQQR